MPEAVRRDPLLAAEDAVMLVDIFIALSRDVLTAESIVSTRLTGSWLKRAVIDNLGRDIDAVIQDARFLRSLLVGKLMSYYNSGQIRGLDAEVRIYVVLSMVWDVVNDDASRYLGKAGAEVKAMAQAADGGASKVRDHAERERAEGDEEMGEIIEQLSHLGKEELREQLLMISERLSNMKKPS